ncbi:MAG: hypothetical protein IPM25_13785 [Chloracidobacterium sp.]|nr:hypothetical protein [Chloracidobacterium sp.]
MRTIVQKWGLLAIGILIGAAYGVVTRLVFGETATMASITYLFLIPAVLGVIPLVFASNDQIRSYRNIIFIPWLTILTFFVTAMLTGLEEVLCLLVLAAPFFVLATVAALIVRLVMIHKSRNKLMAFAALPFLIAPVEELVKSPSETYTVESEIVIAASPDVIWGNIVEVPEIGDDEYNPGIFNRLGIPRPLYAEVTAKEKGATRFGNFQGGLRFVETLTEFEPNRHVAFTTIVDPHTIGPRVFDQHVLTGNYFNFVDAAYRLADAGDGRVRLTLATNYRLTSKVNFYGKFWGDIILEDFQDRLLAVIKKRCETAAVPAGP